MNSEKLQETGDRLDRSTSSFNSRKGAFSCAASPPHIGGCLRRDVNATASHCSPVELPWQLYVAVLLLRLKIAEQHHGGSLAELGNSLLKLNAGGFVTA